ncbi:MAG TPA: ABC transporter permease [Streptosporangiaceae bacterium]|jgi:peptide/nickel transport system permease protein
MAGQVSARARVRDPGASAEQRALARKIVLRVGLAALTVLAVIVLTFVLEFVIPANPARVVAGPKASSQVVAEVARNLGLNRPEWQQLLSYIGGVLHGDLGYSYVSQTSVTSLLAGRLPATALLMAAGIAVELAVGGALGLWDGLRPKRSWVLASINIGLLSVPTFTFGFLLLLLFGYVWPVLPVSGGLGAAQLVLPALTLGLLGAPYYAIVVRDQLREVLPAPFVRTALAKGLTRRQILRGHVLRVVVPPVLTMAGMDVALFLSGVVFVEDIFAWPGIGQLQVQAFDNVDRPVLMGTVIVAAAAVVVMNLVVDLLRLVVDPRVRADSL